MSSAVHHFDEARLGAIAQGVYKRALEGSASNEKGNTGGQCGWNTRQFSYEYD